MKAKRSKGFSELKMKTQEKVEENTSVKTTNSSELGVIDLSFGEAPQKKITEQIEQNEQNKHLPNLVPEPKGFSDFSEDVLEYLALRGIAPREDWLYSPKNNRIVFEGATILLSEYIIIPLTYKNKWYGFQALGWKQKRFFIYLAEGNTSWKVWNYFNIDKNKPVYIFESIYDAISSGLDNVISQLGATISKDRLDELDDPVFCLDNFRVDERAKEESEKYASEGYKVFMWPKEMPNNIKDFNDLLKKQVPLEKIKNLITSNIEEGISAAIKIKMV
jgi:hypothetical protein